MADWGESYAPDMGKGSSVAELLGKINRGSPIADDAIGRASEGLQQSFTQPPNVPPMEAYGVRGIAGSVAQPTVSATIAPENIDQNKFNTWYQNGVLHYGLHPNPNHPDMNINLHDLFAKGGQFVATPGTNPDVIRTPDGKETALTPNNAAMVKTPEQIAQERGQAPAPAAPAPTATQPSVAIAPPATLGPTQPQSVSQAMALPAPAAAPALPVGMPTTGAELVRNQPVPANPATVDNSGKIMTVAGLLASAAGPQFAAAGNALAQLGEKEVVRGRANAAAILAGYPSAEAQAAAKEESGVRRTLSETALDYARQPYIQAETQKILTSIPGLTAEQALTQARTQAQTIANEYKRMMPPRPITYTDPVTGKQNTAVVDGEHVFNGLIQASQTMTHFLGTMASAGHSAAETDRVRQQIDQFKRAIPMDIGGQIVPFNVPEYLQTLSANKAWAEKAENAKRLQLYKSTVEPINKLYEQSLGGKVVLPENLKIAGQIAAKDLMNDPDPLWQMQGKILWAQAGGGALPPSAATAPRASTLLAPPAGGTITPEQARQELLRRRGGQ